MTRNKKSALSSPTCIPLNRWPKVIQSKPRLEKLSEWSPPSFYPQTSTKSTNFVDESRKSIHSIRIPAAAGNSKRKSKLSFQQWYHSEKGNRKTSLNVPSSNIRHLHSSLAGSVRQKAMCNSSVSKLQRGRMQAGSTASWLQWNINDAAHLLKNDHVMQEVIKDAYALFPLIAMIGHCLLLCQLSMIVPS
jgi:hypothetical protein